MGARLTHLFMEVGDLERAKWFWVDAMGLDVLEDQGGHYLRVGGHGGFAIGMERGATGRVSGEGPEICVAVEDVDGLASRLQGLGVSIEEGPVDTPWGARNAWLRDPDGRRITIYSSPVDYMGRTS